MEEIIPETGAEEKKQTLKIFQKGFNYSQDGAGNRLVYHLQGCNMKCPWCSNPEGMDRKGVLLTEREWLTEECCPRGAVQNGRLDRTVCEGCSDYACIRSKRQKGLRFSCQTFRVEEIVEEAVRARPMFFDGGGVTLTGGEISMQFDAVKELLQELGRAGIHRAIECNGSHPRMPELISLVDEWIMDVKHYDEEIHKQWIGASGRQTLENLEKVTAVHPHVLIRVPLIPGFNDSPRDAAGFAALFEEKIRGPHTKVEFLVYHEFGKAKWEQCGEEYRMPPGRIAPGTVEYFERALQEKGISCIRT